MIQNRPIFYWFWKIFVVILNIIKNITKIDVLNAGTMIFEIRMKKSYRKIDSILKMMHSGQIRHFRGYMYIKYYECIQWRKNWSTYRIINIVFVSYAQQSRVPATVRDASRFPACARCKKDMPLTIRKRHQKDQDWRSMLNRTWTCEDCFIRSSLRRIWFSDETAYFSTWRNFYS